MKKIHFIDLSFKNWKNWFVIFPSLLLLIFMLLNIFELFSFQNDRINNLLMLIFFLLQFVHHGRIFFFKNAVEYNKLGMKIRLNRIFPKNIRFSDVSRIVFKEDEFCVTKFGGKRIKVNLQEISPSDKNCLKEILKNHITSL